MPLGDVLDTKYVRAIEENTASLGISLIQLMETAGKCVSDFVAEILAHKSRREGERALVLVGKGGNGGDGLAAARFLRTYGYEVDVALLFEPTGFTHPGAKLNFDIWRQSWQSYLALYDPSAVDRLRDDINRYTVIIDAIFGTGVKYPLPNHIKRVLEIVNEYRGATKISIDVPSGIDPDRGVMGTPFFVSDYTIALHYLKKAYFFASEYCGQIRLCNLGIPSLAEEYVGPGHVRHVLRGKPPDAKKGDGGRVLVIGGSVDYIGAPALSGLAALKAGADLAYVAVPEKIRMAVASFSPSLITVPLGEDYLSRGDLQGIKHLLSRVDSVVLGPGMSFNDKTVGFVAEFISEWKRLKEQTLIIDADALKCLSEIRETLGGRAVLTPHRGELGLLLKAYEVEKTGDTESDLKALARVIGATILLKGPTDYICEPSKCIKNRTGNQGMSTGGTGDVLTGIIAAFVKRTDNPFEASYLAAYVNGVAGDILFSERGEYFDSTDLINYIPTAIRKAQGGGS